MEACVNVKYDTTKRKYESDETKAFKIHTIFWD